MNTNEKKPRQMPKGGRKGGTTFPRSTLADTLLYAKKLVSKTHTGPQPTEMILMGVIGSKHDKGKYGMSALKQYGFMTGDSKLDYTATDLARKIAAAPPEELIPFYRQASLKPAVFKALFETYHGDTVSKAKLKQRAADVKVHPDETGNCVDLYVSSLTTAGLVTVAGEQVTHVNASELLLPQAAQEGLDVSEDSVAEAEELNDVDEWNRNSQVEGIATTDAATERIKRYGGVVAMAEAPFPNPNGTIQLLPRTVFNVNVTLDSSLDIEKLQKQLELLKRFGAI